MILLLLCACSDPARRNRYLAIDCRHNHSYCQHPALESGTNSTRYGSGSPDPVLYFYHLYHPYAFLPHKEMLNRIRTKMSRIRIRTKIPHCSFLVPNYLFLIRIGFLPLSYSFCGSGRRLAFVRRSIQLHINSITSVTMCVFVTMIYNCCVGYSLPSRDFGSNVIV
jgi:hypothetical protein